MQRIWSYTRTPVNTYDRLLACMHVYCIAYINMCAHQMNTKKKNENEKKRKEKKWTYVCFHCIFVSSQFPTKQNHLTCLYHSVSLTGSLSLSSSLSLHLSLIFMASFEIFGSLFDLISVLFVIRRLRQVRHCIPVIMCPQILKFDALEFAIYIYIVWQKLLSLNHIDDLHLILHKCIYRYFCCGCCNNEM